MIGIDSADEIRQFWQFLLLDIPPSFAGLRTLGLVFFE
ncbi:MAG: hypothetical protein M2R45_03971 [Verrucomicrobia subdivision 3 bacterium]|nr:hypothetical protein [Limisphaerales bacterium]MCS1415509.1 hypothetical protein [Limisphaerales bacterium]